MDEHGAGIERSPIDERGEDNSCRVSSRKMSSGQRASVADSAVIDHTRVGQHPISGVNGQTLRDRQPSVQRVEHCGLFRHRLVMVRKDSHRPTLARSDRGDPVNRVGQTIFETLDAGDVLAGMGTRDHLAGTMKVGRGG